MAKARTKKNSHVFNYVVGFFACIGFPAFVTAVAPVSWVTFKRHDGRVSARAATCMFFVVPYKVATVDPVTGLGDRTIDGSWSVSRSGTSSRSVKSESEGFLLINGPDHTASVSVTPFNLRSVVAKAEAFLKDPNAPKLRMFVVANWKFSMVVGGMTSLLTVLYVVGCVAAAGKALWRLVRGNSREDVPLR